MGKTFAEKVLARAAGVSEVRPGEIVASTVKDGTYSILLETGALITNPGCSACAGDGGVMADGEVTLSTANRNFQGRMGSYNAEIYLGSPAVAAATAVRGVITDPREFLEVR